MTCDLRVIGRARIGFLCALLAFHGAGAVHAVERVSGTMTDVQVTQTQPAINTQINLTMDVEWSYGASTLLRDPVVNCGLRVSNIRGTVAFQHQDRQHSVTVTPGNADKVTVVSLGFAMLYRQDVTHDTVLRCDAGVIAAEGQQPFNVANGLTWARTFCRMPRRGRGPLPMRLDHDWCLNGLGGEYLDADAARALYGEGTTSWASSASLMPRILSATVGVTQLVTDEQARLRQEAAAERDAEAAPATSDAAASPYDRLSGSPDTTEAPGATDRLSRLGRRDTPAAEGAGTIPQDRLGSVLSRVENQRAADEARLRLVGLAAERAELAAARDAAHAECEAGRPRRPVVFAQGGSITLLSWACYDRECLERRARNAEIARQREAERRERERREREQRARAEAAERAEHERAVAAFERELPRCLARADEAFQAAMRRLDAEERAALDDIARVR